MAQKTTGGLTKAGRGERTCFHRLTSPRTELGVTVSHLNVISMKNSVFKILEFQDIFFSRYFQNLDFGTVEEKLFRRRRALMERECLETSAAVSCDEH